VRFGTDQSNRPSEALFPQRLGGGRTSKPCSDDDITLGIRHVSSLLVRWLPS